MDTNTVTVTTQTNMFTRIINSFVGTFIGILLFIGAFPVLFWNEGRADQFTAYKTAQQIDVSGSIEENKLYAVKGKLTSSSLITDSEYLKQSEQYLVLRRDTEMYAWKEESDSETETNLGGNQETKTTYKYSKSWVSSPEDSSSFYQSSGHTNPEKSIESKTFFAKNTKLGNLNLSLETITLPNLNKLSIGNTSQVISSPTPSTTITNTPTPNTSTEIKTVISNEYIFIGKGSLNSPEIGDIRISYSYLANNSEALVFGQKKGQDLLAFKAENGIEVYRIFTSTYEQALETVKNEDTLMLWIIRLIGFFMMFIGITMMVGLLHTLSDIVPLFGKLTGCFISLFAFVVSLVLSSITILISIIAHNIFLLIGCIILLISVIGIGLYLSRKKSK